MILRGAVVISRGAPAAGTIVEASPYRLARGVAPVVRVGGLNLKVAAWYSRSMRRDRSTIRQSDSRGRRPPKGGVPHRGPGCAVATIDGATRRLDRPRRSKDGRRIVLHSATCTVSARVDGLGLSRFCCSFGSASMRPTCGCAIAHLRPHRLTPTVSSVRALVPTPEPTRPSGLRWTTIVSAVAIVFCVPRYLRWRPPLWWCNRSGRPRRILRSAFPRLSIIHRN